MIVLQKYKQWSMALMLLIGLTIGGCTSDADPVFLVNVERNFVIPGNLNTIETHFFQLKNIPMLFEQNLSVFNMGVDDVTSVSPGDASFSSSFDNVDWTFIETVEIWMVSRLDNSNRARVFFSDSPDFNNRSTLNMFNTFADIKDFAVEGLIDLEVRIKTRRFVPGNLSTNISFSYAVYNDL